MGNFPSEDTDGLGQFLRKYGSHRILEADEERELCRRIREDGDERARDELVRHNIRLVVSIVKGYINRGVEMEDLVQEGMGGLLHATTKFDERKGFRFSTYASNWILQRVQRLAHRVDTIRLPNETTKIRLTAERNPELTVEELMSKHGATRQKVTAALNAAYVSKSLDAVSADYNPYEQIADHEATPDELVESGWLAAAPETLPKAVAELPDNQREVIELFYAEGMTDAEIGKEIGMTFGHVRKLRQDALKSLRASLAS